MLPVIILLYCSLICLATQDVRNRHCSGPPVAEGNGSADPTTTAPWCQPWHRRQQRYSFCVLRRPCRIALHCAVFHFFFFLRALPWPYRIAACCCVLRRRFWWGNIQVEHSEWARKCRQVLCAANHVPFILPWFTCGSFYATSGIPSCVAGRLARLALT